ncbi:MAG: hypothetical protein VXU46_05120, partial [Planctomycetota bacterium]|nr:hypothetical protein [Planctomycetota bacterium]
RVVASENTGIQPSAPSSNTNDNSSDSKQSSVSETSEKKPSAQDVEKPTAEKSMQEKEDKPFNFFGK